MLGHKLWQLLPQRFDDVWVTIRKKKSDYGTLGLFQQDRVIESVDATDLSSLRKLLGQVKPDVIVNAIAVTKRHEDPNNHSPAIALNALLPHWLDEWGATEGARVLHFSTDCVFDGATGGYTEDFRINAEDIYGRSKALGELHGKNSLTLRTSFIGRELTGGTELLEWFLAQEGKRIRGFRQAIYSGLTTLVATRLIGDIIEKHKDLHGLYHVSSEPINKYELLCLAKKVFGLNIDIDPDDRFICKRNLDDTRFRQATGFVCPSWDQMLRSLVEDLTPYADWRKAIRRRN